MRKKHTWKQKVTAVAGALALLSVAACGGMEGLDDEGQLDEATNIGASEQAVTYAISSVTTAYLSLQPCTTCSVNSVGMCPSGWTARDLPSLVKVWNSTAGSYDYYTRPAACYECCRWVQISGRYVYKCTSPANCELEPGFPEYNTTLVGCTMYYSVLTGGYYWKCTYSNSTSQTFAF